MSADRDPQITAVLTQQEIESVELAQEIYAARAKEAAYRFADVVGLDESTRLKLVGGVALCLKGLNFEERRETANDLDGLSDRLSRQAAIDEHGGTRPNASLGLIVSSETGVTSREPNNLESKESAPSDNPDLLSTESTDTTEPDMEIKHPFNGAQKLWLSRLFSESDIQRIERLHLTARDEFISGLVEGYKALRIPRLTEEGRKTRSEQLEVLMAGKGYKEIADEFNSTEAAIRFGLKGMAEGMSRKIPSSTLSRMIKKAEKKSANYVAQEAPTETAKPVSDSVANMPTQKAQEDKATEPIDNQQYEEAVSIIGANQAEWLSTLLGTEAVVAFAELSIEGREAFTEYLASDYLTLKIPRLEESGFKRRASLIIEFLGGKNHSDLVATAGVTHTYQVANLMKAILENYDKRGEKRRISQKLTELKQSYAETASSLDLSKDLDQQGDAEAAGQDLTEELKRIITPLQSKWLGKIMTAEQVAQVNDLGNENYSFLIEKICQRINAALIRQNGLAKTQKRLDQIKLLAAGRSYEEIAEEIGYDVAKVKYELHHSTVRFKDTTPRGAVESILRQSIEYTPVL